MSSDKENRKDQLTNIIGHVILFILGLVFLYGFYLLDNSETVAHHVDTASGNPSGLRFLTFLGILKYAILLVGIVLTIMTPIFLIKK